MSLRARLATTLVVAISLVILVTSTVTTQDHAGRVTIAVSSTTSPTEFQELNALIDQMIRDGELQLISVQDDPQLAGRQQEAFAQHFRGVRVYGGDVSRQTAQGDTVSAFGIIYVGIDVDPNPTLAVGEAGLMIEQRASATVVQETSELIILPTLDGSYALAYRMTLSDAMTYFVDAHSAELLMQVDQKQSQGSVGSGVGALGDVKKMSTTERLGVFEARDQLRPAEVLTLDTRGGPDRREAGHGNVGGTAPAPPGRGSKRYTSSRPQERRSSASTVHDPKGVVVCHGTCELRRYVQGLLSDSARKSVAQAVDEALLAVGL